MAGVKGKPPEPYVQVLGLLRFSYPSIYNGRGAGEEFESYRNSLYEPSRLRRRLVWFEHVVLPSLRNQVDQDFICVLLVGDKLPEPFRARLLEMVASVPQIKLCMEPEGQRHRTTVIDLMTGHSDPKADAVAEFQLDDDDAVAARFVKLTRHYYRLCEPMMRADQRLTLDFCSGLMLRADGQGIEVKSVKERLWTPALVTYRRPGQATALRTFSHLELWEHMTCVSAPSPVMFVRGAHEDNVSQFSERWDKYGSDKWNPEDIQGLFRHDFSIDLDAFERARAALE